MVDAEAIEVEAVPKIEILEQPGLCAYRSPLKPEDVDSYRRAISSIRDNPRASGVSAQILPEGKRYSFYGEEYEVPKGETWIIFQETKADAYPDFLTVLNQAFEKEREETQEQYRIQRLQQEREVKAKQLQEAREQWLREAREEAASKSRLRRLGLRR